MSEKTHNAQITDLVAELEWRGLVKDATDKDALREHLASAQRKVYVGFDPTADSLTIGNLVPIMMLAHVKRAGHTPVVVHALDILGHREQLIKIHTGSHPRVSQSSIRSCVERTDRASLPKLSA